MSKVLALIIEGGGSAHTSPSLQAYDEYFAHSAFGSQVLVISPSDLLFVADSGGVKCKIPRFNTTLDTFDRVFIRGSVSEHKDIVYCVSEIANVMGIPCGNWYRKIFARTKLAQAVALGINKVSMPKTICSYNTKYAVEEALGSFNFPMIVKEINGSRGSNNYLVKDQDELNLLASTADYHFVIQEYIPSLGDYRYLRIGEEEIVIRRTPKENTHLSNTSQGGQAVLVEPTTIPIGMKIKIEKIAKSFELWHYGADVIMDSRTGKSFLLEINWQPQIISGAFMDEKRAALARALGVYRRP